MLKRILVGSMMMAASVCSLADAPGGNDCGWGNMLFEGKSGFFNHFLASTTNGSSYNALFGMTTGTNGCSTKGTLTYGGGKKVVSLNMDEFSKDVAQGHGEALTAVAVSMGVQPEDREYFSSVMHKNFSAMFTSESVTAEEVYTAMLDVMKEDARLNKYLG